MNALEQWRRIESDVYAQMGAEITEALGIDLDGRWVRGIVETAQQRLRRAVERAGEMAQARQRTRAHMATKGGAL